MGLYDEVNEALIETPQSYGMLSIKSANATINDALNRPEPQPLYLKLWYEGELSCLFAESNAGKSILAVQIADQIARKQKKVLYYDFELCDVQFKSRYIDDESGEIHRFPDTLFRVEIGDAQEGNFEEILMNNIEESIFSTDAKVVIIDNLSYLCTSSEKGDSATRLMVKLKNIKKKYDNLSMLIIAHTPKRNPLFPLTANDLAGSRNLFNFFDSVFAVGKSAKDTNLRYIKQLKCRYGEFTHDAENVIVCDIQKIGGFLQFVTIGYGNESDHLKEASEQDKEILMLSIKDLHKQGKSIRAIAAELNISQGKVQRTLKKCIT